MTIEDLIKQQEKLIADVAAMVAERDAGPDAVRRPLELQEAQIQRVEARIAGLERKRKAYNERVDAELKDLQADLDARRKRLEADRKSGPVG
jgi:hypothetical protein